MAKSLSIITGTAALLLFQQHPAAHAQAGKPIQQTHTVSKFGWMNLRRIDSSPQIGEKSDWYVCGQRKILFFPSISPPETDDKYFEVLGQQPEIEKEFFGYRSIIKSVEDFIEDPAQRQKFMASAATACAAPGNVVTPIWMNLGLSEKSFFVLSPKDFRAIGPKRVFWLNMHNYRKVMRRYRTPPVGWSNNAWEAQLVKYERAAVQRLEINCDTSQIEIMFAAMYDGAGNVRESLFERTGPQFIPPETNGDYWREVVCLIK